MKKLGTISGLASICTMLFGWGVILFLPEHDDPNGVNQWDYLGNHSSTIFIVILLMGAICGGVAGAKSSKRWYVVAALNAIALMFEWGGGTM